MEYPGSHVRDFLETNGHVVRQRVNNHCNLRSFTQEDIQNITGGYCTVLGEGAFSTVYKGKLSDRRLVAVKRYKNETKKEEFANEVIVHSEINHKNVVRLLGVCTEENALMIVMEYICNGNLYNILHCCNANGYVPFPLNKRLDIAIESAEVLSCMHSMYSPVLHGDIKPANILLNENYLPKLSDFGIARLLSTDENQHTNTVIGSVGYMDPLYINCGKLTPKSDVYSFGVVLLEMITRKKVVDGNIILTQYFTEVLRKGKKVRQLFDEEIVKEKRNIKLIDSIAKLASECLKMDDTIRPEMVEVADRLRMIRKALQQRKGRSSTGSNSGHIRKEKAENMLLFAPALVKPTGTTTPTILPTISLDELKEITSNFSNDAQIGEGLYARVFSGVLRDGQKCALKKFKFHVQIHFKVPAVSRFKHENVVQLLGYCIDGNDRVLAYEYASGGSLHDILHGKDTVRRIQRGPVLSWTQRVKIALSAAGGLEFLHGKIGDHQTNVKSSNILLFGNNVTKIGDFGVSIQALDFWDDILDRRDYPTISGYDAPEYAITREASTKSDVYSFGVVLLELITGRKAADSTLPRGQQNLVGWVCKQAFTDMLSIPILSDDKVKQCVKQCVDPRLCGDYPSKAVAEMTAIAGLCVQHEAEKRPDMSVVVEALRQLLHIQ